MIFVTVGTQKFPFDRLIRAVDELTGKEKFSKESGGVFAQIGSSSYIPQYCQYERFVSADIMEQKIKDCSLLITHSGVGTILSGCRQNKPVLIVPRLKQYGEHLDDHQLEIAKEFDAQKYACFCADINQLDYYIQEAKSRQYRPYVFGSHHIVELINTFLET